MKARSVSLLACGAILLTGFGLALAVSREPVSIQGQVNLGTFTGTATVTIAGEALSGTVVVRPAGGMFPRPNGGYDFPLVIHEFSLEGNTFTTTGSEFSEPTDENEDVHTLHGNTEIVAGTGVFEGASGELRVNGQMDWSTGQATFEAHGVICR